MNRWIPLEEKTPENGEHVLLSFANEKQKPLVGIYRADEEGGLFMLRLRAEHMRL